MTNHSRADLHISRKVWHLIGILFIALFYRLLDDYGTLGIAALCTVSLCVELMRLRSDKFNKFFISQCQGVLRREELNAPVAGSYAVFGTLVISFCFPNFIVFLSLLYLAFGDPLASYVGIRWKSPRILGRKTVLGSFTFFSLSAVLSAFYFYNQNIMIEHLLTVSLLGGLVAAISEIIPIPKMDDNFTIPVFSSLGLYIIFYFFGGLS